MTHWLGKKYKLSTPAVLRRFKKGEYFSNDAGTVKLIKPDLYKAKKRLVKAWHNPYTGTETSNEKDHARTSVYGTDDTAKIGHGTTSGKR